MGLFGKKKRNTQEIEDVKKSAQGYNVHIRSEAKTIRPQKDGSISLWIKNDGTIFFNDDINDVFEVTKATYFIGKTKNVLNEVYTPTGITETKRTGRVTGAAIGGLLFGPAGAAVGAAYGTGNTESKEKYEIDYENEVVAIPDYVELNVRYLPTGSFHTIQIEASEPTLIHIGEHIGFPCKNE